MAQAGRENAVQIQDSRYKSAVGKGRLPPTVADPSQSEAWQLSCRAPPYHRAHLLHQTPAYPQTACLHLPVLQTVLILHKMASQKVLSSEVKCTSQRC